MITFARHEGVVIWFVRHGMPPAALPHGRAVLCLAEELLRDTIGSAVPEAIMNRRPSMQRVANATWVG